ncbi:MAG TPA: FUSC family protein [Stellaceae bacterium]|nr:FUSC family protein [Stellaceae bacterium]
MTGWFSRHRPELRLSLQMTVAGLAAYAVGHLFALSQVYWAVLTAVIVMQASIGGSLKASLDRFFGTIGGAGWGVAVSVTIPHASVASLGLALAVALVPLAVAVALWPRYRVAPVTAAIVLLGTAGSGGVAAAALDRVFEIGLGSVIALAVALAVMPSRAHLLLFAAARDALSPMRDLIVLLLRGIAAGSDPAAVLRLHDRIRAAIERAGAIADEVVRERASRLADTPDPDPLVRSLRRLSHDLVTIGRMLTTGLPDPVQQRLAEPGAVLGAALGAGFAGIGEALLARVPPPDLDAVATARQQYDSAMRALRRDGVARALSDDDVERVFGLAFAVEQICRNLEELANRVREAADMRAA